MSKWRVCVHCTNDSQACYTLRLQDEDGNILLGCEAENRLVDILKCQPDQDALVIDDDSWVAYFGHPSFDS